MAKRARAALYRGFDAPLVVEEVSVESPRPGEVMVKVHSCGICHSDLSATNGTIPCSSPAVLGHEGAGVVVEVGEGVSDFREGDHVAVSPIIACGTCALCLEGRPVLCPLNIMRGHKMPDGTTRITEHPGERVFHFCGTAVMAEYATLPRSVLIKVDPAVSLTAAALVGCAVTTGVGAAINAARVTPGSTVVVVGAGGVGLNAIQGAALAGARSVIAVDLAADKLEFARRFGATHVLNPTDDDPVRAVRKIVRGGTDCAIECIGRGETIQQAFDMVRSGGTCVVVGVAPMTELVTLRAFMLPMMEKVLVGSLYGSGRPHLDVPKYLGLYQAGKLKIDELVTQTYSIDQAPKGFSDMKTNARGVVLFD
jgi:S-(hydroxymethyl)glutathione dehydrogenase/alcohol dehydrogenase